MPLVLPVTADASGAELGIGVIVVVVVAGSIIVAALVRPLNDDVANIVVDVINDDKKFLREFFVFFVK